MPWQAASLLGSIVAPLAGAWIEITKDLTDALNDVGVAPLAGAWIEICSSESERNQLIVAPLAGAWIEIRVWTQ